MWKFANRSSFVIVTGCYFDWTLQHENAKHLIFNWISATEKKTTTHGNRKCYRRTYSIPGYPNIHTLTYSVSWWNCWWFSIKPMAKLIHILFFTFMPNISIAGDWALFRIFTKIQSTILYQSIAGIDIYDFIAEADFHILSRFSAISVVHYVGESLGHQFGRSRYNWVNFSTSTQLCWTFLAENVK